MRVGIIGCGFIGTEIAGFIDKDKNFDLIGMNDIDKEKAEELIKKLSNNRPKFMDFNSLIAKSDLIIESADRSVIELILKNENLDKKNKKLLIMSSGGLINRMDLLSKIKNCEIFVPSGAIAGLDAVKSVSGKIKALTLTTTKPLKGLDGAPYVAGNKINLSLINDKKMIFEGSLRDAVSGFPKNINVAATLFLASKFDGIKVKIFADPNTKFNTHEIEAVGDFGEIKTTTKNLPSKNPRTSYIAVLSAISAINGIKSKIKVGN